MSEATFKVVTAQGRTVYDGGSEADARQYVQDHYPRVHVDPGGNDQPQADAVLVAPDGSKQSYNGGEWSDVNSSVGDATADSPTEPAPNASKAAWKTYALSQTDDADDRAWIKDSNTTRDDLIKEYGSQEGGDSE